MSAIACPRIASEFPTAWTGLPCDVPGVVFGKCCTCGFPDHGASGLQPRSKQTGAEELSVPKLSLALSHQCPQGVCEAKGAKNLEAKGGNDLLRKTCQVHLQLT